MASVRDTCARVLPPLEDDTMLDYIAGVLEEADLGEEEEMRDMLAPMLVSIGATEDDAEAEQLVSTLVVALRGNRGAESSGQDGEHRKLDAPMTLGTASGAAGSDGGDGGEDESQNMVDFMWRVDKVREKRNDAFDMKEWDSRRKRRKDAREQARAEKMAELERKRLERYMAVERELSQPVLPEYGVGGGNKDIIIPRFSLNFAGNDLLVDAQLKLAYGRRYGLLGRNGIGKSTLIKHMARYAIEGFPRHLRITHVSQEIPGDDTTVLNYVLQSDYEREVLLARERELFNKGKRAAGAGGAQGAGEGEGPRREDLDETALSMEELEELEEIWERVELLGLRSSEARAASILSGLQFTADMQGRPTRELSGGWRMRVALACALFVEPDVLLLDEPTNHLDLHAVLWLEDYLQTFPHTLLVVSHDRNFLNNVITDVIYVHDRQLLFYRGDYANFERVRAEELRRNQKAVEAADRKRAHVQAFIDKFRANAKRASLVQSRVKALDKMPQVAAMMEDPAFRLEFPDPEPLDPPVLQIREIAFGYTPDRTLFRDAAIGVDLESRIGLLGPNGAGKSTLLKIVMGDLSPTEGSVVANPRLRMEMFTQHHVDKLDMNSTPLLYMMKKYQGYKEPEMRSHLARFGVTQSLANQLIRSMSGGQKSRVSLADITFRRPHVLVLDEPTNHLDLETIAALALAVTSFEGAVIVVSHDQYFLQSVCQDLYTIEGGAVVRLRGSFEDYKKRTAKKLREQTMAAHAPGKA